LKICGSRSAPSINLIVDRSEKDNKGEAITASLTSGRMATIENKIDSIP
jgi:hypothetical protein